MAFEIQLPQEVGRLCREPLERPWRRRLALEQPTAPQNAGYRARRRYGRAGLDSALQHLPDLPSAPGRVRAAQRQGRRRDGFHRPSRRHLRPARAIQKPLGTKLGETLQPFIARLSTDPEPPAELGHVGPRLSRQRHQIQPLRHGVPDLPRHRHSPDRHRPGMSPMSSYRCYLCLRSVQPGRGPSVPWRWAF
jgi:hypothetical protein